MPSNWHPSGRAFPRVYDGVQRRRHHEFVEEAVRKSGGRVLFSTGPSLAPLFLAIEDEAGIRHGIIAYVFWANSRKTRNRPPDEHRLQIRYGDVNNAKWRSELHPIALDPAGVDITVVVGAEAETGLVVALDPLLYDPLPIGISVFWKDADVAQALKSGWHPFERDNISGVRRAETRSALGLETVIALRPERFLDLLRFEREAQTLKLDPALRLAGARRPRRKGTTRSQVHQLEKDYGLPASTILAIIAERSRLAMAVRGGVAEHHAERVIRATRGVREAVMGMQEGPPDFWVRMSDGRQVTVEVKNASPKLYADGQAKVEVQKTRASKGDLASRYYKPDAFDVLAACMFGPTGKWSFRFRRSRLLERHPNFSDRIYPLQRISDGWASSLTDALSE
jgi:hypothetical protein